jgi:hypothetical protein
VFAQEEQQLRRPRDDPFRRQAIVPRRPGRRSLSSPGRRAASYRFGDEAIMHRQTAARHGGETGSRDLSTRPT